MYFVFDIGATHMRFALSKDLESLATEPKIVSTPVDYSVAISQISDTIYSIISEGNQPILAAAGGISGVLKDGKLINSPHLSSWNGRDIKADLQAAVGADVKLFNDAAIVGLGEAIYGAGKGVNNLAYITVSTGIGGCRIVNGRIDQGQFNSEPGHQLINVTKAGPEELESYLSGAGIQKRYHQSADQIKDQRFWQEMEQILAYGLHNVCVMWSPEVIVLGGGIINAGVLDLNRVREHLSKTLGIYPQVPELRKALLEGFGGLYGGMALLKSNSEGKG